MVDDAISVVAGFCSRVVDPERRLKVVRACKELFAPNSSGRHRFALKVITSNVLGKGRIHAANALEYFGVSPYIILDGLYELVNVEAMATITRPFDRSEIIAVVRFVANKYASTRVILDKMREQECFRPYDVVDDPGLWAPQKVRRFLLFVCKAAQIEPPDVLCCLTVQV